MQLSIGTTYKFTLVNNAFMGSEQIGKLISICDYDMAMLIMDVGQIHINIYPNLPNGANRDPKQLEYYVVQTADASKIVLAAKWLSKDPDIIDVMKYQYTMEFETNAQRMNFEQLVSDYGFKLIGSQTV